MSPEVGKRETGPQQNRYPRVNLEQTLCQHSTTSEKKPRVGGIGQAKEKCYVYPGRVDGILEIAIDTSGRCNREGSIDEFEWLTELQYIDAGISKGRIMGECRCSWKSSRRCLENCKVGYMMIECEMEKHDNNMKTHDFNCLLFIPPGTILDGFWTNTSKSRTCQTLDN